MTAATYDGNGERASTTTTSGGTVTSGSYVWNTVSTTPLMIMDSTNAYVYVTGLAPAEQVNLSTGTVTYLISDSLGSVRGTLNPAGSLTGTASYDAWGNPDGSGGVTSVTPFGYAGGYTDSTGLIYLVNRYYDPSIGQFISIDPLIGQTLSPYGYANGNPVSQVDPTGEYGYNYVFPLGYGSIGTPRLVSWIEHNFNSVFPFWGCPNRIATGQVCRLDGFNPVLVVTVREYYFELLSLPGHTEGPWKHIVFSYWQSWGNYHMRVHAYGPNNTWCNRNSVCAAGNRAYAYLEWSIFAGNIFWNTPWGWLW